MQALTNKSISWNANDKKSRKFFNVHFTKNLQEITNNLTSNSLQNLNSKCFRSGFQIKKLILLDRFNIG